MPPRERFANGLSAALWDASQGTGVVPMRPALAETVSGKSSFLSRPGGVGPGPCEGLHDPVLRPRLVTPLAWVGVATVWAHLTRYANTKSPGDPRGFARFERQVRRHPLPGSQRVDKEWALPLR